MWGSVKQADYQESGTVGLSTYRLSVDGPGQLSGIHQVDVALYHCDTLGVICWPIWRQRTVPENAHPSHLTFDSATGRIQGRFENGAILSCS
jgi:hypothetical protein